MAAKDKDSGLPATSEVESNHNSLSPAEPIGVARVAEMGDYNPMRKKPNKANVASDVTNIRETADEIVEDKGTRPYRANVEANAETVADTSAANDATKAGAIKASAIAAAKPQVANEVLPDDVTAEVAPASDSGTQS